MVTGLPVRAATCGAGGSASTCHLGFEEMT
jgi:hypothetical protein